MELLGCTRPKLLHLEHSSSGWWLPPELFLCSPLPWPAGFCRLIPGRHSPRYLCPKFSSRCHLWCITNHQTLVVVTSRLESYLFFLVNGGQVIGLRRTPIDRTAYPPLHFTPWLWLLVPALLRKVSVAITERANCFSKFQRVLESVNSSLNLASILYTISC